MDIAEIQTKEAPFDEMQKEGVLVVKQKINLEEIKSLTLAINKISALVMSKIKGMERPLKTYSDIAERHLNRLDYRCGFTADIFNSVEKPIIKLIQSLSPLITFRHYWGAIPSLGGAGPTNMHRDVYPILNSTPGVNLSSYDLNLPPYYFTVLIPLIEITKENGPTAFIKGSHLMPEVDENKSKIFTPLLSPGDFVIFDGRTLHKGLANKTKDERLIAYITFVANWYHDQTFTTNHYLFPKLVSST